MKRVSSLVLLALATVASAAQTPSPKVLKAIPGNIQWGHYDADAKPVIAVKSGETIRVETVSGNPDVLTRLGAPDDDNLKELKTIYAQVKDRGPGPHLLTGPIAVEGAAPGNVLQVDILEIHPRSPYGFNVFGPTAGILLDEFPYAKQKLIPLNISTMFCEFAPNIRFPARPFFGSIGVAPTNGRVHSSPPGYYAGNLDNKELVAGTTLYIPVLRPEALLNIGDGHLAMGDGEVDVTAVESPLTGVLRLTVRKDMHLLYPRAETSTHYITMGFHETLDEAARRATREMVEYLATTRGLSREDAYMLTSVAVDMHVTQVVDGVRGVHMMLPKAIFVK
jgi:acetamidase/formamidase